MPDACGDIQRGLAVVGFATGIPHLLEGEYAESAGTAHGKRAQCFGGAGYGSTGERCMGISVAVPVGEQTADRLVAALAERIAKPQIGRSDTPGADFGPLVAAVARGRIRR